ncbi:Sodium:solute symporter family protein [Fictibacillus solisalsi]|uniref:Sodium:solute symporter family protein n=1 Tax=Fictibacillus solisalsi TaxID=459525 RepID=A0A1G9YIS3_9BACL|nr:sodium:solute symporter family protein [Fictibacillus solisalsi]SDN08940.1 Sodium:solute symporter family protein [Fictibacillus solisalsi]
MHFLDWLVLGLFFIVMLIIGFWSFKMVKGSEDYFVAGGKMPWWLSGISHHVSGHSGAVFVAYAGLAYTQGVSLYFWWALPIFVACTIGAYLFAPRWSRLRSTLNIESPTEYLALRYNIPTQQVIAWSGVLLKLFDVGAKWAAIGILLNVFTGIPIMTGVLISGLISLVYITVGGLWADVLNDFVQFVVQLLGGIVMFIVVMIKLGGPSSFTGIWDQLPAANSDPFREPYTAGYVIIYAFIVLLSYNGGTWNLATRFISSPSGKEAKKSSLLSAILYLVWPIILFFPMWAAPLILPNLKDPTQSYALLTQELLPQGLVGLVLASLFAATMSMTSSDSNTIASVITRDILPVMSKRFVGMSQKRALKIARITTLLFTALTLVVAINSDMFGGVIGLLITWFAALVGPVSIPMLFGLLPAFKHCGPVAAIVSIAAGLAGFVVVNYGLDVSLAVQVGTPVLISFITYSAVGWLNRNQPVSSDVGDLLASLNGKEKDKTGDGSDLAL